MTNISYSVIAIVTAIIISIIFYYDYSLKIFEPRKYKSYSLLMIWIIVYAMIDAFGGLCLAFPYGGKIPLTIATTLFDIGTGISAFVWLNYVLTYAGDLVRYKNLYYSLGVIVTASVIVMTLIN